MPEDAPPPSVPAPSRMGGREMLLVAALAAAALLLRLHQLGESGGLWLDEAWGVLIAGGRGQELFPIPSGTLLEHADALYEVGSRSWLSTWTGVLHEAHPPGFYSGLRLWITLFGQSDLVLRLPSVLCSVASIVGLYVAVRQTSRSGAAAVLAMAIAAVSPAQIYFAQEARNYMPMQLLLIGLATVCFRIVALGATRRRLVGLAVLLAAGMLTHYYFAGPAAGMVAYTLWRSKERGRVVAAVAGAAAAFGLAWGPWLIHQHPWAFDIHAVDLKFTVWRAVSRGLSMPIHTLQILRDADPISTAVGLAAFGLAAFGSWRRSGGGVWWAYLLGGLLFILTIDLALHRQTLAVARYTVVLSPPLFALLSIPPRVRGCEWRASPAGVALLAASLLLLPREAYRAKSAWKPLGEFIAARAGPGDIIVYHSTLPHDWRINGMYLSLSRYAGEANGLPQALITASDPVPTEVRARLLAAKRLWVLTVLPAGYPLPGLAGFTEEQEIPLNFPPGGATNPLSLRVLVPAGPAGRPAAP